MADVIKSWDRDENLLILRQTLLSPVLSMQASWLLCFGHVDCVLTPC